MNSSKILGRKSKSKPLKKFLSVSGIVKAQRGISSRIWNMLSKFQSKNDEAPNMDITFMPMRPEKRPQLIALD